MEFFIILFAIIGFGLVNEFGKRASSSSSDESDDGLPSAGDVEVSRKTEKSSEDDFAQARKFVEQTKRERLATEASRAEMKQVRSPNTQAQTSREFRNIQPTNVSQAKKTFLHKDKKKGKNYVDSIARLRRETEILQAQAREVAREANSIKERASQEPYSEVSAPSSGAFFKDARDLRRAFIASEILSTPISLRK